MVLVKKLPFFLFFYALYTRKMCSMLSQNVITPFQAIKTRISKSRKIDIFPKGLSHGFGRKMAIFPTSFFYALKSRRMYSMIFQNEKTLFLVIKTRSSKSRKINIFPKGLTHAFGQKMAIFRTFLFTHYRPRKCILRYSGTKKRLSRL